MGCICEERGKITKKINVIDAALELWDALKFGGYGTLAVNYQT
jgi:hypothetical protein